MTEQEQQPEDPRLYARVKEVTEKYEEELKRLIAEEDDLVGFYHLTLFRHKKENDEGFTATSFQTCHNLDAKHIASHLVPITSEQVQRAEAQEAMDSLKRIINHDEPEMRALQVVYDKLRNEIGKDMITKNMMIYGLKELPNFVVQRWPHEHMESFIERFELVSEEDAVDKMMREMTVVIRSNLSDTDIPPHIIRIAAQQAAERTKEALHLDIDIEQLTQRYIMAIDPRAKEMM